MKRLRSKLTYANVMATVAVFVALGGASYAAVKLPKNSVGSKQIKTNAVTEAKIKNGAVTGAKIAPGTITGANVNAATLGTVPKATSAQTAVEATAATTAKNATNATHATSADKATNAGFAEVAEFAAGAGSPEKPPQRGNRARLLRNAWPGHLDPGGGPLLHFPLPAPPTAMHVILLGESNPAGCSGNEENPGAAPGNLCVFEGFEFARTSLHVCAATGCVSRDGVMLIGEGNSSLWDSAGSWAVTAP